MSLGTRVMRSLSNHAIETGSEISARRRGDLALALASAARGVASLSSSTATRRRFRCRARRGARARESRDTTRRRRAGFDVLGRDRTIARRAREGYERVSRRLGVRDFRGVDGDDRGAFGAFWWRTSTSSKTRRRRSTSDTTRARARTPRDGVSARRRASRRRRDGDDVSSRRGPGDASSPRTRASRIFFTRAEPREPRLATTSSSIFRGVSRRAFHIDEVPQKRPRVGRRASAALHPAFFDAASADLDEMHASGESEGACVRFVRGAVAISRKSGGARVARAPRARAGGASDTNSGARRRTPAIFSNSPRGRGRADARHLARRPRRAPRFLRTRGYARRDTRDGCRRAGRRTCPGARAPGAPPERFGADEAATYSAASRRGALAILRVALDAVSGADKELARETYRRVPHAQTQGARGRCCVCVRPLEKVSASHEAAAGDAAGDFAERERLALISKLIASAPACLSRRELPGVRYYAETFHCLAVTHAPALVERCALPALAEPETKPFVAALDRRRREFRFAPETRRRNA